MHRPDFFRRNAWVLLLCLAASQAWAMELPELMSLLSQHPSVKARFNEQRFVRDLDAPVKASGVLSFEAPGKLVRETLQPRAETMSVNGNVVTLTRSGRTRTMALDSVPELLGMVEAMRGTLTGNAETIKRYFRSTVTGSRGMWTLELQPLDARLLAQVKNVRITGADGLVKEIELEFGGGDRSVTTISAEKISPSKAGTTAP